MWELLLACMLFGVWTSEESDVAVNTVELILNIFHPPSPTCHSYLLCEASSNCLILSTSGNLLPFLQHRLDPMGHPMKIPYENKICLSISLLGIEL